MIKYFEIFFCCLIGLLLTCACSDQHQQRHTQFEQWIQNNGKVKTLCSTAMIYDLVKQVGGEHVDVLTLVQGELDPHSYQLVKGDDEKLTFAQLIFYNGLGLEHGPSLHTYLVQNDKAVSLGDRISHQKLAEIIYVNGQKDPHIWMDISLWAKTVPIIVETLSQHDPNHAAYFAANGIKLQVEMERVHNQVKELMHQVPADKRFLVTSHDAFNYFARAYLAEEGEIETKEWEKRFAAPEGLAPESQLSTKDIQGIIDHLKQYNIHSLFPESNVSKSSIKKIVQAGREHGLNVSVADCALYGDSMGAPGSEGDTYLKMIHYNARRLAEEMNAPDEKG